MMAQSRLIPKPFDADRLEDIVRTVERERKIRRRVLLGLERGSSVESYSRSIAVFLARTYTTRSYHELGWAFRRDHSTLIHSVDLFRRRLAIDHEARRDFLTIRDALGLALMPILDVLGTRSLGKWDSATLIGFEADAGLRAGFPDRSFVFLDFQDVGSLWRWRR